MRLPRLIFQVILLFIAVSQNTVAQNDSVLANIEAHYQLEQMTFDINFNWVFTNESFDYSNYDDDDTVQIYNYAKIYFEGNKAYIIGTESISGYYIYQDSAVLLYDFGLNISDTAYFEQNDTNYPVIVESISYESIVSGQTLKKLTLSNQDAWIQGIGSIVHPLWPVMSHFEVNYTVCHVDLQYLNITDYYTQYYATNECQSNNSITQYNDIQSTKNLIKTVDLLGRETDLKPNILLINIYDDGSIEKVFVVE